MISLRLDDAASAALSDAAQLAEVRAADGRLLGYFVPAGLYRVKVWAETAHGHTDEVRSFQGEHALETVATTRQVFEHLKALPVTDEKEAAHSQALSDSRVEQHREAWQASHSQH
jgi:hypothetical protein